MLCSQWMHAWIHHNIDEDDVVDAALIHRGVAEALLHGLHALVEEVSVELLETAARNGRLEVNAVVEGVNVDAGLARG